MSRDPGRPRNSPRRPPDLSRMVAVAAGPSARVVRWAMALRAASIPCSVVNPYACESAPAPAEDYTELWVACDDSERADSVLRTSEPHDSRLVW
jgi:hypothetical protein